MEPEEMYEKSTDFREYVDRFLRTNPQYSKEEAFKHKIIRDEIIHIYKEDPE
jgi:hypothetical protein